ncbi:MAG: IS1380 family transposase [Gammaproteobacteria bacterium]|nr:IS1380 family transposase [Gammaproteobacteria bacterium]
MTKRTKDAIVLPGCKSRKVEAEFGGQVVTSDGGVSLLKSADSKINLLPRIANGFVDTRRKGSCSHSVEDLLKQRIYALALGYEDLNDHNELRNDPALQTAVGRDVDLAGASTLCRFENRIDKQALWNLSSILVDVFIESHSEPPEEIVLDFDSTDDRIHGDQEGKFYHGYYRHYCFLPLYVFCGDHLLVAYHRPSDIDNAKHALAILGLLVKRIRQDWPDVKIIYRGDSGFCRWKAMRWCENNDVGYILGFGKNKRINKLADFYIMKSALEYEATGEKQRQFGEVRYAAGTWDRERRVIVKAEHLSKGPNTRYIVTNLNGGSGELYQRYCNRGEMENKIKEQQLYLFADRTSCSAWLPNQFRLLLSGLAYTLLNTIRHFALSGTDMSRSRCDTIRLKLLKIGAVVVRNTRRVRFLLSASYPYKEVFERVCARLCPV